MQNFRSFGPLGAELQAPPYPRTWTLLSPFLYQNLQSTIIFRSGFLYTTLDKETTLAIQVLEQLLTHGIINVLPLILLQVLVLNLDIGQFGGGPISLRILIFDNKNFIKANFLHYLHLAYFLDLATTTIDPFPQIIYYFR